MHRIQFREVNLPVEVAGRLFLHGLPGRRETIDAFLIAVAGHSIGCVVCLEESDKLATKSPDYAALRGGSTPWERIDHPIPDFSPPRDLDGFWATACKVSAKLCTRDNVLIHCGAGIGRTGMMAMAVLLASGVAFKDAKRRVRAAGSGPETAEQKAAMREI